MVIGNSLVIVTGLCEAGGRLQSQKMRWNVAGCTWHLPCEVLQGEEKGGNMKKTILWVCAFAASLGGSVSLADAGTVARMSESGESIELSQQVDGRTVQTALPLHRAGSARYFSAGVGLEERMAEYPPFPLKLVFTAGGKPFLAGVSVTIQPLKGGKSLTIPEEQVEGPWLFVDLASGQYDVVAAYGGRTQVLKGVSVEAGKQKTLYLRWAEDRGLSRALPGE